MVKQQKKHTISHQPFYHLIMKNQRINNNNMRSTTCSNPTARQIVDSLHAQADSFVRLAIQWPLPMSLNNLFCKATSISNKFLTLFLFFSYWQFMNSLKSLNHYWQSWTNVGQHNVGLSSSGGPPSGGATMRHGSAQSWSSWAERRAGSRRSPCLGRPRSDRCHAMPPVDVNSTGPPRNPPWKGRLWRRGHWIHGWIYEVDRNTLQEKCEDESRMACNRLLLEKEFEGELA